MVFRKLTSNDYIAYLNLINEFRETQFSETQFNTTLKEIEKSSVIWVYEEILF